MAAAGEIELVLIVRGGGEPAALAYLDNEVLARQVATMSIPVITGLGHAENRTLLEEVAWHAAETPTDAAQHVIKLRAAQARLAPDRATPILQPLPAESAPPQAVARPAARMLVPDSLASPPAADQDNGATKTPRQPEPPLEGALTRKAVLVSEPNELPGYPRIWGAGSLPVQTAEHARRSGEMMIAFADGTVPIRVVG
jgi:hypothetical protein